MTSVLSVTTAASDTSLLTTAELRRAVGLAATDASRDAELAALGQRLDATIARACRVRQAGVMPPTLRQETLSETFRLPASAARLVLARWPVVSVASVTEDGAAVAATDYEMSGGVGMLRRLSSDAPTSWAAGKIVVAYVAGWATVPPDLKQAAEKLAAVLWSEGARADPSLRREAIPGVIEREWWVGPRDDPALPGEVLDLLAPYMNAVV